MAARKGILYFKDTDLTYMAGPIIKVVEVDLVDGRDLAMSDAVLAICWSLQTTDCYVNLLFFTN